MISNVHLSISFSFVIIISIIVIIGIISSVLVIKHINYTKTYEYRLGKIGYSKKDIKLLEKEMQAAIIAGSRA